MFNELEVHGAPTTTRHCEWQGVVRRGDGAPHYFRQGARVLHSPTFWTEIGAKVSPLFQLVSY